MSVHPWHKGELVELHFHSLPTPVPRACGTEVPKVEMPPLPFPGPVSA